MKYILCGMLCCVPAYAAMACGACGGGSAAQGSSSTLFFTSYVALQYRHSSLKAQYPSLMGDAAATTSRNYYNTAQLSGRYILGKKWQLLATVPYQYNTQVAATQRQEQHGLGDISVQVNTVVANKTNGNSKDVLLAGLGAKLPTGNQVANSLQGTGLPETMPGTGSWDGMVSASYMHSTASWGYGADASYTLTTANRQQYKYGNRLSTAIYTMRKFSNDKASIVPQLGLKYEYSLHDYDNYKRKWLNTQTGGSICYAFAGIQTYNANLGFTAGYYYPVAQQYASGLVLAQWQCDAGFFILF
jgi:hypothetical protein